jgi:hypothetical protein
MKALRASVSIIAICITLSSCTTFFGNAGGPCGDRPVACFLAGAGIVAAIAYIGFYADDYGNSNAGSDGGGNYASDARLKRDVVFAGTLENGIKLYTFRYWNDDRVFSSVMAQDLLADPRFRHSVHRDASGYYIVDLAAIGLGVTGDAKQLHEASSSALKQAKPR